MLPPTLLPFFASLLTLVHSQLGNSGYRLMCYTCMSDNVPQISKDIMRQTINIPDYSESRVCNQMNLTPEMAVEAGIRLEPCETACIKVGYPAQGPPLAKGVARANRVDFTTQKRDFWQISKVIDLQVTLRGCLDRLYNPGYLGFPLPDSVGNYRDTCDRRKQSSSGIGETVTDTCICTGNYCNTGPPLMLMSWAIVVAFALLVLFPRY